MGFGRGFDTYSMRPEHLRAREDTVGSWLSRRDPRRPFFLFLHGYDVHEPYAPPEEFRLRFIDEVPVECPVSTFGATKRTSTAAGARAGGSI